MSKKKVCLRFSDGRSIWCCQEVLSWIVLQDCARFLAEALSFNLRRFRTGLSFCGWIWQTELWYLSIPIFLCLRGLPANFHSYTHQKWWPGRATVLKRWLCSPHAEKRRTVRQYFPWWFWNRNYWSSLRFRSRLSCYSNRANLGLHSDLCYDKRPKLQSPARSYSFQCCRTQKYCWCVLGSVTP